MITNISLESITGKLQLSDLSSGSPMFIKEDVGSSFLKIIDRLLKRIRDGIPTADLHRNSISLMVSWELEDELQASYSISLDKNDSIVEEKLGFLHLDNLGIMWWDDALTFKLGDNEFNRFGPAWYDSKYYNDSIVDIDLPEKPWSDFIIPDKFPELFAYLFKDLYLRGDLFVENVNEEEQDLIKQILLGFDLGITEIDKNWNFYIGDHTLMPRDVLGSGANFLITELPYIVRIITQGGTTFCPFISDSLHPLARRKLWEVYWEITDKMEETLKRQYISAYRIDKFCKPVELTLLNTL